MTFEEQLSSEQIRTLPLRDAIAIDEHTVARAAIALMRTHHLGCAVIVDQNCRPTGVFTEQSIIRLLVAGASLDTTPISSYAEPDFSVVRASDPIMTAWKAVVDSGRRFMCVTDDEGYLIGLTGQRGLADYVCDCYAKQITVQRLGSAPWMLQREGA
ncbi:CBS domain-containing protein [Stieleria mannarensis]|uniref:CBS domain-containing protein n=1 Tax=Stieleria mannarensis TaxID=2755585 RepID=UPI001604194A|nr:CBS domain-containing protein [Rhodopirellula sp. JC639]